MGPGIDIMQRILTLIGRSIYIHTNLLTQMFELKFKRQPTNEEHFTILSNSCLMYIRSMEDEIAGIAMSVGIQEDDMEEIYEEIYSNILDSIISIRAKKQAYFEAEFLVDVDFEPLDDDFLKWVNE